MGKPQGFHAVLTGFSWFNSWSFHEKSMGKKNILKSHENPMK